MSNSIVAGVDIGGTHITAALVNIESGLPIPGTSARQSINTLDTAGNIIDAWCQTVAKTFSAAPFPLEHKKVGIAMPGPFDYERGICYIKDQGKYESLYGLPVKDLMADNLDIPASSIRMMNDALCFLQGEVMGGAVNGFGKAAGLTLGTGLGSALYSDGVTTDANLWEAPFFDGIAEDYLAARWFVQQYQLVSGRTVQDVKELVALIPSDPAVVPIFETFGRNLGTFIGQFLEQHDPEVIVVGGNIAKSYQLFLPALEKELTDLSVRTPIRIAALGEDAQIIGAAACWASLVNR